MHVSGRKDVGSYGIHSRDERVLFSAVVETFILEIESLNFRFANLSFIAELRMAISNYVPSFQCGTFLF